MSLLLFCFAHAGGNPLLFKGWQRSLPANVSVVPMEPPGRGQRFGEPPLGDYGLLVERLASDMRVALARAAQPTPSYALFGHSAGARFAFGAALSLVGAGLPQPQRCIFVGASPPHRASLERRRSELPDEDLLRSLQRMGGSPDKVLADAGLMQLMLPLLRADFRANEQAHCAVDGRLECPFTLLAAREDREFDPGCVFEWARYTSAPARRVEIAGDHFSIVRSPDAVLREIAFDLASPAADRANEQRGIHA
jgi:medium-chain acyl-[acyl-carrier-protein] hydrolase